MPWDEIATPKSDYYVRLATSGMAIPVLGQGCSRSAADTVELTGSHRGVPAGTGDTSGHRRGPQWAGGGGSTPVLALQQRVDATCSESCDPHRGSCASGGSCGRHVALAHLRRWKAFAGRRRHPYPEEVRGWRTAHASVVARLLPASQRSMPDGRRSRPARLRVQQGGGGEIAVRQGAQRRSHISEDRAEVASGRLFLVVQKLAENPRRRRRDRSMRWYTRGDGAAGCGCPRRIPAETGCCWLPAAADYDAPAIASRCCHYEVAGDPRLVRSDPAWQRGYPTTLNAAIAPFACVHDAIFEGHGSVVDGSSMTSGAWPVRRRMPPPAQRVHGGGIRN